MKQKVGKGRFGNVAFLCYEKYHLVLKFLKMLLIIKQSSELKMTMSKMIRLNSMFKKNKKEKIKAIEQIPISVYS